MKYGWLKIAGLGLALTVSFALLGWPGNTQAQNIKVGGNNGQYLITREKLSADYEKAMEVIRANYVEPREYDDLTKYAIQGMLHVLDPHSDYMDAKAFREFNDKQHSRYFGIGAYISTRLRSTYITEPFNGSPAYRAGLHYGDQIINVDGKDTANWDSTKTRELLLGERGTKVRVTIKRPGVEAPQTFDITRDQIALPSIPSYYLIKPNIGYIGLTKNFQSTTSMEMANAIAELREQGATQFILDLRGNGGGYLEQGILVADKLLQRGQTIVSVRGRNKANDQSAFAETGASENFPLVVLINGNTASASEIVAGAVQDHDRGLIVGETSFGKGLVQRIFPTMNGGGLILTIAHYYTPSGRLIQRDYSNGSLFDYYAKRNANGKVEAGPKAELKQTDTGRQVYGGGGIEPDVKVEFTDILTPAQQKLFTGSWLFVAQLINGQIPGVNQYKLGGMDFSSKLKGSEYLVNDEVLKAWSEYMNKFAKEHSDFAIKPAEIEDNKIWARKFVREEVLNAAYGQDRAKQVISDLDLQLQRAIQEMPNASALYDKARTKSNAMNRR
ncbi:MAG: S41 family peptidase [Acidobacteria bacterium]|nr:S41 family peptidase [Acidobacteriota bacterium]MBI3424030.1 S41 family peptidase [Acidobacteriota bacterium]